MVIIALLLASVVFLSVILLVGAMMLRGQWEKMGTGTTDNSTQTKGRR